MKRYKFTFRYERDVWHGDTVTIKYRGHEVGTIGHSPHKIRLSVVGSDKNNPNCGWRWITYKKTFDTFDEAKLWLNENRDAILDKYELRLD